MPPPLGPALALLSGHARRISAPGSCLARLLAAQAASAPLSAPGIDGLPPSAHQYADAGVVASAGRRCGLWIQQTAVHGQGSPWVQPHRPLATAPPPVDVTRLQEALERAILEAYRLLQEDQVERAEMLVSEGLRTTQQALGESHPLLAQVADQAALLQFFLGRFREAHAHAAASLEGAARLPAEEGQAPAVALCQLRLGTILLGLERAAEAAELLQPAHAVLSDAFGPDFEPAGEAAYYIALATLPAALSPSSLAAAEPRLLQGLQAMRRCGGVGRHLVRAALREHRVLMDRAVDARDWLLAEAILQQAGRLQAEVSPASEEAALTSYQYATLQYVRGLHGQAEQLCEDSLALARRLYRSDASNQVALRLHRLGTIHLAVGAERTDAAVEALSASCDSLTRNVGDVNPLTGESRAALALARLRQLDAGLPTATPYARVLAPRRRAELQAEAREGLAHMERGFGREHMLVVALRNISRGLLSPADDEGR